MDYSQYEQGLQGIPRRSLEQTYRALNAASARCTAPTQLLHRHPTPCLTLAQQRNVGLRHQPRLVLPPVLPILSSIGPVGPPAPAGAARWHLLPPVVLQILLSLGPEPIQLSIIVDAIPGLAAAGGCRVCRPLPSCSRRLLLIFVIPCCRPPAPPPQLTLLLPQVPAAARLCTRCLCLRPLLPPAGACAADGPRLGSPAPVLCCCRGGRALQRAPLLGPWVRQLALRCCSPGCCRRGPSPRLPAAQLAQLRVRPGVSLLRRRLPLRPLLLLLLLLLSQPLVLCLLLLQALLAPPAQPGAGIAAGCCIRRTLAAPPSRRCIKRRRCVPSPLLLRIPSRRRRRLRVAALLPVALPSVTWCRPGAAVAVGRGSAAACQRLTIVIIAIQ